MIENKYPDSQKLEQLQTDAVEAPWIEVRGKRILIVEDQEPVRVCLRMMLELEGHQVTEASDGAEALKLFAISYYGLRDAGDEGQRACRQYQAIGPFLADSDDHRLGVGTS
jgi:hypothetical protein